MDQMWSQATAMESCPCKSNHSLVRLWSSIPRAFPCPGDTVQYLSQTQPRRQFHPWNCSRTVAQPIIVTLHKYPVLPREPTSGVPLLTRPGSKYWSRSGPAGGVVPPGQSESVRLNPTGQSDTPNWTDFETKACGYRTQAGNRVSAVNVNSRK